MRTEKLPEKTQQGFNYYSVTRYHNQKRNVKIPVKEKLNFYTSVQGVRTIRKGYSGGSTVRYVHKPTIVMANL